MARRPTRSSTPPTTWRDVYHASQMGKGATIAHPGWDGIPLAGWGWRLLKMTLPLAASLPGRGLDLDDTIRREQAPSAENDTSDDLATTFKKPV